MRNEAQTEKAQDDEIERYRKARRTVDSCIDEAVSRIMRLDPHKSYQINVKYVRAICWRLTEETIDAYTGTLELEEEV